LDRTKRIIMIHHTLNLESLRNMSSVDTILIDCDGVLTDGKMYMDHTGEKPFKAFDSKDIRAIREIVSQGIRVIIVTADDGAINAKYAHKVGAELIQTRDKGNLPFETFGIFWVVCDDAWDYPMAVKADKVFCPLNVDTSILRLNPTVIQKHGGQGVIAELIRWI
jgi:3-deoxy-D-manno-octulosonate 8-phosphate phosphatase KdsC-like HAD superfamily phosphatase